MDHEALNTWGAILTLGSVGALIALGIYVSNRLEERDE